MNRGGICGAPFLERAISCRVRRNLVTMEESLQLEKEYRANDEGCYILSIGANQAVDGSRCFGRIGRMINHASWNANIKLYRPVVIDGQKRVPFVALGHCHW